MVRDPKPHELRKVLSRKVLLRTGACALLGYHMLAVSFANLGTNTKLRDLPHRWFRPYTSFFGQWQEWDMFTTIPYYASVRPSLIATNADGSTESYEPWLPGLESVPESLKVTSLFARVMWSRGGFTDAVNRIERAACTAITQHTNSMPKSIQYKLDTQRLNSLQTVRTSNKIAHPEQFTTKPTACRK